MIEDLLSTAESLARLDRTKPRQACLRRALSNAYYAAFHALMRCCAEALVGRSTSNRAAYARVYRALDHGTAKTTLISLSRSGFDPTVSAFAEMFVEMQELRFEADYNPLAITASRQVVLNRIAEVRAAIDDLGRIPQHTRLALATHLLFKPRR